MKSNFLAVQHILSQKSCTSAQLSLLINHQLTVLNRVRTELSDPLASHVLHALLKSNKLVIYTDSAMWASQLRFYADAIRPAIENAFQTSVKTVKIKVIHLTEFNAYRPRRKAILPSQPVIDGLRDQSLSTSDPSLKKAFAKLSDTLERLSASEKNSPRNNGSQRP